MSRLFSTALAVLLVVAAPALARADNGIVQGCALGQSFTSGPLTVTGAFLPATPKGAPTAAAYMQIANAGAADTFTGATSPAGGLTLHRMTQNGNVMQMAEVTGGLPIPAGGTVSLDVMTYHLMLSGMPQLKPGDCVEMTLHFANAGDVPIVLNVGGLGSTTPPTAPASGISVMPSGGSGMDAMSDMSSMQM